MRAKDRNLNDPLAWCPGCGNFGIREGVKQALEQLELEPHEVAFVSGIGQAAKAPHYIRCNLYNGLHGRTLPVATGLKLTRPDLTVICEGGDGDGYAEGGNHFLHALRRNLDITYLVHDNQVYGLTKGQASPTSDKGMKTATTPFGSDAPAFNPLALAVTLDTGFVGRGFCGNPAHLAGLIAEAVRHPGFALVEILQNCVSFNKVNTAQWYRERVRILADGEHDPTDRAAAFKLAREWGDTIPLGVIYRSKRPALPIPVRDRPADTKALLEQLLQDLD
ncbi:MAG TPA: 2-oxoacid:ferredoxin oxidoreductase subunit beta [candidate division WOR-3 bacterium]|uniref:2-oxoacid:ferredoxin oxidoreductase subunit beta n=1 Tax=candidate division WOR-3 bacterium TaxID=2052148 RepID=A0A7V0T5D7_UNCW3|nr:2-oxoacid:ferredoxin oxidoreductase subunit beta [candidate division WOR-3 bacterium]